MSINMNMNNKQQQQSTRNFESSMNTRTRSTGSPDDTPPTTDTVGNPNDDIDNIYSYYKNQLIPAITSSLPLLFYKILEDTKYTIYNILTSIIHFLIPWTRNDFEWYEVPHWLQSKQDNFTQFLLRTLDTNHDGTCILYIMSV